MSHPSCEQETCTQKEENILLLNLYPSYFPHSKHLFFRGPNVVTKRMSLLRENFIEKSIDGQYKTG